MKKQALILIAAVVFTTLSVTTPVVRAQSAAESSKTWVEKLSKDLELTPEQTEKLKPVVQDRVTKMKAINSDTLLTESERKTMSAEVRETFNKQLLAILTPEQKAKFAEKFQKK
jgi:Spy/CpxP family protein refolding chaperone